MSSSEALKKQGNDAFSKKDYSKALLHYSEAIDLDPNNHTLYSNRSGSYCALGKYEQAAADAKKAIEIKPDWVKGYTRLGAALQGETDWTYAEQAYRKAIELDPSNDSLKSDLTTVLQKKNSEESQDDINSSTIVHLFNEKNLNRLSKTNHQFSKLLQEPEIQDIITSVRNNSKNLGNYYNNKKLQQILTAILTGDVHSTSSFSAKEDAEEEKVKGNASFKAGKFEEALEHYNKAIELDEFNITCYNNKATVYNKQGKYQEAIQVSEEAIKKARQCNAPFEVIAKTYQKIASSQNSLGNLDLAIEALKSSLIEKKDVQVQKELRKLEVINQKKKAKEYENPELGEKARKEGNDFFNNNEFSSAIECYNEAIKRDPRNPLNYTDRAAAYTKLSNFTKALNDCQKALELDPKCGTALCKRAQVHLANKELYRAKEDYNLALSTQPGCEEAIQGLFSISKLMDSKKDDEPDEERIRRHMADPEIQRVLRNPKMQKILRECRKDPKLIQYYYKNPETADDFKKLHAAGIIH